MSVEKAMPGIAFFLSCLSLWFFESWYDKIQHET